MKVKLMTAYAGVGDIGNFAETYETTESAEKKILRLARKPILVRVSGDSMEPRFKQGNLLLFDEIIEENVFSQLQLCKTDTIIFCIYRCEFLIKQLNISQPVPVLYSYNANYKPIPITEFNDLQIIGVFVEKFKD